MTPTQIIFSFHEKTFNVFKWDMLQENWGVYWVLVIISYTVGIALYVLVDRSNK
jgi:hypothetical protein